MSFEKVTVNQKKKKKSNHQLFTLNKMMTISQISLLDEVWDLDLLKLLFKLDGSFKWPF